MAGFMQRTTIRGYVLGEVVSALQKSIRRCDEAQATWWAAELEQSGFGVHCWNRLIVICSEDVGIAWPEGPAVIRALHQTWVETTARRNPHRPERLFTTHAAMLLARAPKSRRVDTAVWANYGQPGQHFEIPDYAIDRHTARGRAMGRGDEHFFEEGMKLVNEVYDENDDPYWERWDQTSSVEQFGEQWGGAGGSGGDVDGGVVGRLFSMAPLLLMLASLSALPF